MGQQIEAQRFKNWAFISYSHVNSTFAERLHRKLEGFSVPRSLRDAGGVKLPSKISPVFIDRAELPAGQGLDLKIRQALEESRFLIVVCSRDALTSSYVAAEIGYFSSLGRSGALLPIIPAGEDPRIEPLDLLPPGCRVAPGLPLMDSQGLLIADARKGRDGETRAILKIIAGMLNVSVGELKSRDASRRIWKSLGILLVAVLIFLLTLQIFEQVKQRDRFKQRGESLRMTEIGNVLIEQGAATRALVFLLSVFPEDLQNPDRPLPMLTLNALRKAVTYNRQVSAFGFPELKTEAERGHFGAPACLRFVDETHLLVASQTRNGTWSRRNVDLGTGLSTSDNISVQVFSGKPLLTPDCKWILGAGIDGSIILSDLDSSKTTRLPTPRLMAPTVAAASSDSRMLAVGDSSRVVLWNLDTGRIVDEFIDLKGKISMLRFSEEGRRLAWANQQYVIHILEIGAKSSPVSITAGEAVAYLTFTEADMELMVGTGNGDINTYDPSTGTLLDRFRLPGEAVLNLTPTQGGVTAVSTNFHRIFLYGGGSSWSNLKSRIAVRAISPTTAANESKSLLANLSKEGILRVFDVSREKLKTIESLELATISWELFFSPERDLNLENPREAEIAFAFLRHACLVAFGPNPHKDAWTAWELSELDGIQDGDIHLDAAFKVCGQVWDSDQLPVMVFS